MHYLFSSTGQIEDGFRFQSVVDVRRTSENDKVRSYTGDLYGDILSRPIDVHVCVLRHARTVPTNRSRTVNDLAAESNDSEDPVGALMWSLSSIAGRVDKVLEPDTR